MRRPTAVVSTVDLPSGKILEVVHPDAGTPYTRVKPAVSDDERDLSICEACDASLVEPLEWESAGHARWRLTLHCPNCDRCSQGVFSQDCVDRFDERLDDATAAMVSDLKRLEHARIEEELELFVNALNAGAILPEDF